MLLELELAWGDGETGLTTGHGGQPLALAHGIGQIFVVPISHFGLVVVEVHLGRATHHVQIDDVLALGWEMGGQTARGGEATRGAATIGTQSIPTHEAGEGSPAHGVGALGEKVAAGHGQLGIVCRKHGETS